MNKAANLSLEMAIALEKNTSAARSLGITHPMDRPWFMEILEQGNDVCGRAGCLKAGSKIKPEVVQFSGVAGDRKVLVAQCKRCESIYFQPATRKGV